MEMLGQLFGGIGLFLLGMQLMTNGLKQAAGQSLRKALEFATQSKLRGLISGTLITALVQSSSAVTVATLGFVNAGLLTLGQSIAVIYGCNIGTTMTGWLVALIGFKIKISAFALPMIGAGVLGRVISKNGRLSHAGTALAGFGLFFIGLDFLKSSFDGLSSHIPLTELSHSPMALALFVVAGIVMTFLMQASAAVMAIALSLVHTGSITLTAAAALVIGANVGTTTTALMASIGATSNAKRISAAHVIFNLLTGLVGVIFLALISGWLDHLDPTAFDLVTLLALYHTLFNLTGVAMIWPFTDRLEKFLNQRFQSRDEDSSRPQYLDANIVTTPSLAIEAMHHELIRLSELSTRLAREVISNESSNETQIEDQAQGIYRLVNHISQFNQELARQNLTEAISETLPISLRVARYFSELSRLSAELHTYPQWHQLYNSSAAEQLAQFQQSVVNIIALTEITDQSTTEGLKVHQLLHEAHQQYQTLKSQLLEMTVRGEISTEQSTAQLDALSLMQRMAEQAEKASSHWSLTLPLAERQPVIAETAVS